jgi:uncharacterized protein (TIGR04255 family)
MPDYPQLSRPPIVEVLIDIKVALPPGRAVSFEEVENAFAGRVQAEFPTSQPLVRIQANLDVSQAVAPSINSNRTGRIFWSKDQRRAVQARADGFSVNHVGSYEGWNSIKDDAKRLWADYLAVAQPIRVLGISVRYINRMVVPVGLELSNYLRTFPEVGKGLPNMNEFFLRLVLSFSPTRFATLVQNTAPNTGPDDGHRFFVFDIDTASSASFDPREDELWVEAEELRRIKNKCFFDSLQPQILEEFK